MPIERLTAEDELMLWPDEVWPQDIGALVILDGATLLDAHGGLRIEAVRRAVEGRLHLVPRFRQLLHVPPPRLGGPLWVDALAFDIRQHVRVLPIQPPGGEPELLAATERLRRRRLERSRPLWEMWFLTGLADRRVGLFVRMHHCIADGVAGVATVARFLDASADAAPSEPEPWTPATPPTQRELEDDAHRRRAAARRAGLSSAMHPAKVLSRLGAAWPAIHELVAERPLPATSLDHVVGQDRRLALLRTGLEPVKDLARAHGAKVNDVLLALIAGGLGALLRSRHETVAGEVMRVYVPVSLRGGDREQARGNLIAQMVIDLPVGASDHVERLRRIAAQTGERKARVRPNLGKVPHRGFAGRAFLRLVERQRVNVSSANLHGPEVPLYFAGARLLEVFPMVQLLGRNSLTVGAISYAGRFDMMVVADRNTYPDLEVFTAGMLAELEALGLQKATVAEAA